MSPVPPAMSRMCWAGGCDVGEEEEVGAWKPGLRDET